MNTFVEVVKVAVTAAVGGAVTYFYQKRMKSREEMGEVRKEILKNMIAGVRAVELSASAYREALLLAQHQLCKRNTLAGVKQIVGEANMKGKVLVDALTIHRMYVTSLNPEPGEMTRMEMSVGIAMNVLWEIEHKFCDLKPGQWRELTLQEFGEVETAVNDVLRSLIRLRLKIDGAIKTLLAGQIPR